MVATQALPIFLFARANGPYQNSTSLCVCLAFAWRNFALFEFDDNIDNGRVEMLGAADVSSFFLGHDADTCDLDGFRGKGEHLPVALDALAGFLVIFRVVDDGDESLLGDAGLHLFEPMIGVREVNEENLELVALRVGLDAFINRRDDVVIENVVENLLDLLSRTGSASVADEKR